ncbi:MAG: biopolymer transporter ExbD [Saprospiraceae bacterium]|nr:biopolymer transporter ExbD [Saprospiraceae bacterium]
MSTRIDFTPMVDLGFLLITFFMLTTTLAKPNILALVMPEKDIKKEDVEPVKESKVLTLLLGPNDKVYWYEGITDAKLDSTDYSAEGLRQVILNKMEKVKGQFGMEDYEDFKTKEPRKGSFINVIIKPTKDSRYKNLVDALDEMAITKVRYYVILDISKLEEDFIKNPAAGLKFNADQQVEAATK